MEEDDGEVARRLCRLVSNEYHKELLSLVTSGSVNVRCRGRTLLMTAAVVPNNRGIDIARHLLSIGANANLSDKNGMTAIHYAAQHNNADVISLLHSTDSRLINYQTICGSTPIMLAVSADAWQSAGRLLQLGANIELRNAEGRTIAQLLITLDKRAAFLAMASTCRNSTALLKLRSLTLTQAENNSWAAKRVCQLAAKGLHRKIRIMANIMNSNVEYRGVTPLTLSAAVPDNAGLKCLRHLLKVGADPTQFDKFGMTALQWAVVRNNDKIITALYSHNSVLINSETQDGLTPLMLAVTHNNANVVQLLVKLGANINLRNRDGLTATDMAVELGVWTSHFLDTAQSQVEHWW